MTSERPIDAISDRYVEDAAALEPLMATYLGIEGHDDKLPDLSPDGFAAREQLNRDALAAATATQPTDEREAVAKAAFLERLGLAVEQADAGMTRSEVSVIGSGLHEIRQVFDLMPTETDDEWAAIDARLAAIPDTLVGYRETLREEAAAGRVSAARQYAEVAAQVRRWTGQEGEGGDFFARLAAGSGRTGGLAADLERHAAAASSAYAEFGHFLADELAPVGRQNEACGREHYALASRGFLGAEVDLDETYAWGWEELHRLTEDMAATSSRIVPDSTATGLMACGCLPCSTIARCSASIRFKTETSKYCSPQ